MRVDEGIAKQNLWTESIIIPTLNEIHQMSGIYELLETLMWNFNIIFLSLWPWPCRHEYRLAEWKTFNLYLLSYKI